MANYGGIRGLGVNVRFSEVGATLALLGNMMQYYPAYVDYIKENAPKVANEVAVKYFNNLSKSKSKNSPFMRKRNEMPYIIGAPVHELKVIPGHLWSRELSVKQQSIDLILDMWSDPRILWYIEGTKRHDIFPKNKKFLLFYWERYNKLVFAKHVDHPGARKHRSVITDLRRKAQRPLMAMIMRARQMFEVGKGGKMSFAGKLKHFGFNATMGKTPFDNSKAMSGRQFLSNVLSGKIRGISYV